MSCFILNVSHFLKINISFFLLVLHDMFLSSASSCISVNIDGTKYDKCYMNFVFILFFQVKKWKVETNTRERTNLSRYICERFIFNDSLCHTYKKESFSCWFVINNIFLQHLTPAMIFLWKIGKQYCKHFENLGLNKQFLFVLLFLLNIFFLLFTFSRK